MALLENNSKGRNVVTPSESCLYREVEVMQVQCNLFTSQYAPYLRVVIEVTFCQEQWAFLMVEEGQ